MLGHLLSRDWHAVWIRPRSSDQACGSCHGLPPGLPHPQLGDCSRCHGAVIDRARAFVAPDLHVDGKQEVVSLTCSSCHGSANRRLRPPICPAAPTGAVPAVGGAPGPPRRRVASRPVGCNECHLVPSAIGPGHPVGWDPAQVTLSGVANLNGTAPSYDRGTQTAAPWCHGPVVPAASVSPAWTSIGPLPCNGLSTVRPRRLRTRSRTDCYSCHGDVDTLMQITKPLAARGRLWSNLSF